MVFLIIQSLGSDCVPVEQMLSSGCSAANRPLGTHNPSYYSLPTVFLLPASHCISPWFSTVFVCIVPAFPVAPLSLLYLLRIDYHFVPMIAQFERRMTFLSFGLAPIDQVLAKSAAAEETEEEANWWPTHLQTLVVGKAGGIDRETPTEIFWIRSKCHSVTVAPLKGEYW